LQREPQEFSIVAKVRFPKTFDLDGRTKFDQLGGFKHLLIITE